MENVGALHCCSTASIMPLGRCAQFGMGSCSGFSLFAQFCIHTIKPILFLFNHQATKAKKKTKKAVLAGSGKGGRSADLDAYDMGGELDDFM